MTTKQRISHHIVKKQLLRDISVRNVYNELEEEYQLLQEMLTARQRAGKTQKAVAKAMHTTPSAVSRLESLHTKNHSSPSLATLKKYAQALGCKLSLKLIPVSDKK